MIGALVRQTGPVASPPVRTSSRDSVDALLSACADGDPAAFTPVYDALGPVAYGASLGVLRDPDHAAEVTQEVMVEVWQTAARFDAARGSARTWVAARDIVAEDVERRLEGSAVRRCIEGLTPTQREAVVVAYYGGLTYREVAEQLDAALPTVKSRIRDGLIRLKDCLGVARHV
jgi:RNA polymerase sigma-70 factor (ECF subfamily)